MNYYDQIKESLIKCEIFDRTKDYSKDRNKVNVLLSEVNKEYGKNIIKQYSEKLMLEVGKKYNERNLRYMRQFFEIFTNIKGNPTGSKLSWSHYRELLVVKDETVIIYYINVCEKNNRYVIEYCNDERIFSREYQLI